MHAHDHHCLQTLLVLTYDSRKAMPAGVLVCNTDILTLLDGARCSAYTPHAPTIPYTKYSVSVYVNGRARAGRTTVLHTVGSRSVERTNDGMHGTPGSRGLVLYSSFITAQADAAARHVGACSYPLGKGTRTRNRSRGSYRLCPAGCPHQRYQVKQHIKGTVAYHW